VTDIGAQRTVRPIWILGFEIVLAGLCYYALARGSLLFASLNASATPIWPPTGLAIAIVLMRGRVMLAAIFLGALLANLATTPLILTAGAIALGNSFEAFVAVLLLQRWADGEQVFHSPVGIAKFAFIVIAAAAPLSACVGVTALAATGFAPWSNYLQIWVTWWLGDVAGAILAAPALVLWARTWRGADTREFAPHTVVTLLGAAAVGLVAFSPLSPAPSSVRSALAFLAILPLLWAAIRLGLRDTATTALVMSSLAIWGVVAGSSPFNQGTLNDSLLLLVAFIVAATLPSLALAADRRATQAALNQTRQELVQAQKLEALGQLTGGVAHDFNNLLTAIQGGLRSLSRQEEERARTLEMLTQTLDRGTALTKHLLAFARREPLKPETVNPVEVLQGMEALIGQSLGGNITVETRTGAGLWPIKVERNQLELAVLNLALNARDAMPAGGAIVVEAHNVVDRGKQSVAISVADTGVGMTADVLVRAFEPFYSTKPPGAGTGLGLAQVFAFAKRSGGHASIDSALGEGTTATITLPRA
jgi:signal transduction histidine kinase